MSNVELDEYDSSKNLLTAISLPKQKPGRPSRISDEVLIRSRNELLFTLEETWALIGWELQQAETPPSLQAVFRRIQGINCRGLEYFCLEYRRETTFPQLLAARKRLDELSDKLRATKYIWERCKESSELVQPTLKNLGETQGRQEMQTLCQETVTASAQAWKSLNQHQTRWKPLENAVRLRQAAFAQSELLKFIRRDRYASTPLNFANAMAGLPTIHWRQSMARCLSFQEGALKGLNYRRFQFIAEVTKQKALTAEEAVERMKAHLLHAKGPDVKPCNALAENWYFLRCAIESVFRGGCPPEDALPFRILADYQTRSQTQSPLDTLQKQREIITTPAFVKERRR